MRAIVILLLFFSMSAAAQVRHNFPMGPQKTNCDTLVIRDNDFEASLQKIEGATWRYTQSMHLNRPFGFRSADFYSCDGQTGYLVIRVDEEKYIYMKVPVSVWEEFSKTSDPENFIKEKIDGNFSELK